MHRLQVRLVMGGHTSGGTAASEGGPVLFQTLFVVWVGDSFGGGLGQNYFTQLTTNFFATMKIQSVWGEGQTETHVRTCPE